MPFQSLSLGRPPSLCIKYMDCQRPSYSPDFGRDPSESLHYCSCTPVPLFHRTVTNGTLCFTSDQEWKHSCYRECLAPVLEIISQPSLLEYNVVIELDKKIRDFSIPDPFRSGALQSRSLIMQKASLSTALEAGRSFG